MKSVESLASVIEAHGCVTGGIRSPWELNVSMSGAELPPTLTDFAERWGGEVKGPYGPGGRRWIWRLTSFPAAIALRDMYSFLRDKQDKATELLDEFTRHPKWGRVLERIGDPPPPMFD
jgi:hypothetical protein